MTEDELSVPQTIRILMKLYRQFLKLSPVMGTCALVLTFIDGIFPALQTIILANLFDAANSFMQGNQNQTEIMIFTLAFVASFVAQALISHISDITSNIAVIDKGTYYARKALAQKGTRIPLIDYEDPDIHDLRNRALDCIDDLVLGNMFFFSAKAIASLIGIVSIIGVLASYHYAFVLISLLSVAPNFIARIVRGRNFYKTYRAQVKKSRKIYYLYELFIHRPAIKEMRAMQTQDYLADELISLNDTIADELFMQAKKDVASLVACDIVKLIGFALSLWFAFLLVAAGAITVGLFAACIGAFTALQSQTKIFLIGAGNQTQAAARANDYYSFLDLPEEELGTLAYTGLRDCLSFEEVSFSYPQTDLRALEDVSFSLARGQKIAVVGENGSGKTTLSKLLLGMYCPAKGEVCFDGIKVQDIERESLFKTVSIIAQDFVTYSFSMRDNIALSDTDAIDDDERLREIIEQLGLENALQACGGLDGKLGREFDGAELSGGQEQRLAIARGIFRQSDLVILDEPTSALDPLIEAEILSNFLNIVTDKTAIIISHRVGLCKLVDKVAVMEKGRLVEIGSHDELMKKQGFYHHLYNSQEKWYRS